MNHLNLNLNRHRLSASLCGLAVLASAGLLTSPVTRCVTCPTTAPIAFATPACSGKIICAPSRTPTAG